MSYYRLDTEKVLDVCNLTDWLFFHDNDVAGLRTTPGISDEQREDAVLDYLDSLKTMLKGGPAPDQPWEMSSINDLINRFAAKATPEGFTRLAEAFDHYSTVTIGDEASNLLRHQVTDLDSYMHMRAAGGSSATVFYHVVTQYVLGIDIDQNALKHELVERYWAAIMDYWYLPNDLLSFRAECARGDHNNAVCLLRRSQGATLQEAVDTVARMIDDCQDIAVRYWNEITSSHLADVPGLLQLLETFQHIGAANHRWSFMAPRYHGRGFVWNGVLTGELRLTPTHPSSPTSRYWKEPPVDERRGIQQGTSSGVL